MIVGQTKLPRRLKILRRQMYFETEHFLKAIFIDKISKQKISMDVIHWKEKRTGQKSGKYY